jgi:pentapeptide repeat protein
VRHTVIRVIAAHLREDAVVSWQGLNFDFTGVVFDGGDFHGAQFSGGTVSFRGAHFSGVVVDFSDAEFSGGTVDFRTVNDWSSPPAFPWTDTPPSGVKLPRKEDQSEP